jgi:hypothetical protein
MTEFLTLLALWEAWTSAAVATAHRPPDPALVAAVKLALAESKGSIWPSLAGTALGGLLAIIAGAFVQYLAARSARKAFERDVAHREAVRLREKSERAEVSALRLATVLEAYGRDAAGRHFSPPREAVEQGGGYSDIPKAPDWPGTIDWEALGAETAGQAFAFHAEIEQRREHISDAHDYDPADTIYESVPRHMLAAAASALRTARAIRARHGLPPAPETVATSWDWRVYVDNQSKAEVTG